MLKDLLFPKMCLVCGFLGCYICLACEKKLNPIKNDSCLYCGKLSYLGFTHPGCKRKNGIDGLLSMYFYNPVLRAVIRNIKYKGVYDAFHEFFYSIREPDIIKFYKFKRLYHSAFLQPVPLHKAKIHKRGFNQSVYITRFIQSVTGYKAVDFLIRSKDTHAQAQIKNRQSRYLNIKNAFSLRDTIPIPLPMNTVVLVDDVVTTGSTVREAAQTLKESGIENVFVFSLARG